MISLTTAEIATSALPAFLASLVEFVEALTIVLAVGITRGWRSALTGAAGAVALLALVVAAFGPMLVRFPVGVLQIVVGSLLILFGTRWLRKAVLRAAGVVPTHDEEKIYAEETSALRGLDPAARHGIDWIGFVTSFKAVTLEGLEVAFIVIAVGSASHFMLPASLGAAAAGAIVIASGVAIHKPLSRVPENGLKFSVGVLLSAFGTFWAGEGLGLDWPGKDFAIAALVVVYALAASAGVLMARSALRRANAAQTGS